MPFVEEHERVITGTQIAVSSGKAVDADKPEVDLGDQIVAAAQRENLTVNLIRTATDDGRPTDTFDADFNVLDSLTAEEKWQWWLYEDVFSHEDLAQRRQQIDRERLWEDQIEGGPWNPAVVSSLAAVADPTIFAIPFLGPATRIGGAVGSKAITYGIGGAAEAAFSEALLQRSQVTRPLSESALNTAAGAVVGGALGAGAALISGGVEKGLRKLYGIDAEELGADTRAMADMAAEDLGEAPVRQSGDSVGAARASDQVWADPRNTEPVGSFKIGEVTAKLGRIGLASPAIELGFSPIAKSREFIHRLTHTNIITKGQVENVGAMSAVEPRIKTQEAAIPFAYVAAKGQYKAYKARMKQSGAKALRYGDFQTEVGRALIRSDEHAIPEVAEMAEWVRQNVFEPFKKEAIRLGKFPEDVGEDELESYLMRAWDQDGLKAQPGKAMARFYNWYKEQGEVFNQDMQKLADKLEGDAKQAMVDIELRRGDMILETSKLTRQINKLDQKLDAMGKSDFAAKKQIQAERRKLVAARRAAKRKFEGEKKKLIKNNAKLTDDSRSALEAIDFYDDTDFYELAADQFNVLANSSRFRSGSPTAVRLPNARGPLAERTFTIPNSQVEDFIHLNALDVVTRFVKTMAADLELTKLADELGTTLDELPQFMAREIFDEGRVRATAAGGGKASEKIMAQAEREAEIAGTIVARLRGLDPDTAFTGATERNLGMLRQFNVISMLGDVMFSSIPDVASPAIQGGVARSFGILFSDMARGLKGIRMAKKDLNLAGDAWDMVTSQRTASLFETPQTYSRANRTEQAVDAAGQAFGIASGMNPWNTIMKSWAGAVHSTRLLEHAQKVAAGKSLTKFERAEIGMLALDDDILRRIARQSEHWSEFGSVKIGNPDKWTDQLARDAYLEAMYDSSTGSILTPGVADAPLWTGHKFGKLPAQFLKFGFTFHNKIAVNMAQRVGMGNLAVLNGVAIMLAMGAMRTVIRDMKDDGTVQDRSAAEWANEAIVNSGFLAPLYTADNLSDNLMQMSIQRAVLGSTADKFAWSRDREPDPIKAIGQTVLGPTGSTLKNMGRIAYDLSPFDKDGITVSQKTVHAARKLAPLNNATHVKWLLDAAEEAATETFNLPRN